MMLQSIFSKAILSIALGLLAISTASAGGEEPARDDVSAWASAFLSVAPNYLQPRYTTVPIGEICDYYADRTGVVVCYPEGLLEAALYFPGTWHPASDIAELEAMRDDATGHTGQYIDRILAMIEDRQWRVGRFLGFEQFESHAGGTAYNVSHSFYQMDRVGETLSEIAEFHLWNDLELDIEDAWDTPPSQQSEETLTRGAVDQLLISRIFVLCALMERLGPNPICEDATADLDISPLEMGEIMLLGAWDQQENMMRNGVADWRLAAFDSQRVIDHDFAAAVASALEDTNLSENPDNPIWHNPFLTGNPYTAIIYGE